MSAESTTAKAMPAAAGPARAATGAAGRPDSAPAARPRSLWPKEHGAYAQLALPLLTALAMARPGAAALLLTVAAAALFMAHEPALVLLGTRGERARRQAASRARRHLLGWTLAAAATGLGGLALASREAQLAALLPLAGAVALVPFVLWRADKTLAGELVASAALAGAAVPVAVASGVALPAALAVWGAWSAAFALTTVAVRWVIQRAKQGRGSRAGLALGLIASGVLLALGLRWPVARAMAPMLLVSWALLLRPPHPRQLKRVGWTLVAATLLTAALVVVASRLG